MKGKILPKFLILFIGASLVTALGAGCARKVEEEPEKVEEIEEVVEEEAPVAEEEVVEEEEEVAEEEPPPPPPKAPDFTSVGLSGGILTLSQIEAKVIVLNFWLAMGSPQSEKQITELVKLYEKYREQGLKIIGISLDQGRDAEVKTFVRTKKIAYPVCVDTDYRIFERYQPGQFPATFVIGEDRTLVRKFAGFVSFDELEAEISALLTE